jgi:hypothetical protein
MQTAKAQMTIRKLLAVVAVFAGLSSLSPAVSAQTPSQFISFNAPGAGTSSGQGTFPDAINRQGWIGGTVILSSNFKQGFLREPNGSFLSVLPPGAAQSFLMAVNSSHESAGFFYGTRATYGFLRDAAGNFTQLGVAGSNTTLD